MFIHLLNWVHLDCLFYHLLYLLPFSFSLVSLIWSFFFILTMVITTPIFTIFISVYPESDHYLLGWEQYKWYRTIVPIFTTIIMSTSFFFIQTAIFIYLFTYDRYGYKYLIAESLYLIPLHTLFINLSSILLFTHICFLEDSWN